ncbi:class I adenylate-forming enzyme family protein [Rhodanobacter sp. Col0626]|uniref:class I adenylate-forming enzyme family protein n=1 Tax=Rhodanobacter sp. Col0626 TaxID=3415679 RepID=UPI003CF72601
MSYEEFGQLVDAYAAGFARAGVARGDFVGLATTKSVHAIAAFFGAMQAGGCPCFMEARISVDELVTRMGAVGMRMLVCDDPALMVSTASALTTFGASVVALDAVQAIGSFIDSTLTGDDRALLLFTSGSTGRPKGVLLSHANLLCNAHGVAAHTQVTAADRLLHVMPLHHTNGVNNQLIVPLLCGAQIVLIERFRADDIVDCLRRFEPTYVTGVPTMYSRMLPKLAAGERFPSLRFLRCGSAPITTSLHEEIEAAFGVPLLVSYGLSEATCTSTMNPPSGRRIGSIGTVLDGQELALFKPGTDERVADGMEGEIRIRGAALMLGYIGAEVASPVVDGWLRSGDLGCFDDAGFVTITGRIKDVIIRGGENLSPGLIESYLQTHPSVRECCVIGTADADLGEVPVAFVVAKEGDAIEAVALQEHVLHGLSRVYVPAHIHVLSALPTGSMGKVDRNALKRMANVATDVLAD